MYSKYRHRICDGKQRDVVNDRKQVVTPIVKGMSKNKKNDIVNQQFKIQFIDVNNDDKRFI